MVQVPGPTAWQSVQQFMRDPLQMFADAREQWGDVVRFSAFGYELYQVTDAEMAQEILKHPDMEMSAMMEHPFTGHGLANSVGDSWKNQRRLMQTHFHHRAIRSLGMMMVVQAEMMLEQWKNGTVVDVLPELIRLNHQILGLAILNVDFYKYPQLLEALRTIRVYLNRRFQAIFTVPDVIPSPRNLGFKKAVSLWDGTVREMIREMDGETTIAGMLRESSDPRTGGQMSDSQLRDEINTLFFNGYEDTGATVTWALYLLCQHGQAMQKLQDEIQSATNNQAVDVRMLGEMPYLDRVLNETLRLYPTTWAIMRDAKADVQWGDFVIPEGASVQVTVYLLHRHEKYWQDANQFRPERFEDNYPENAYMPFGAGPRQCIGKAFAMMQMKLILATLLQNYDFELVSEKIRINAMASLHPEKGLKLRLSKREQ